MAHETGLDCFPAPPSTGVGRQGVISSELTELPHAMLGRAASALQKRRASSCAGAQHHALMSSLSEHLVVFQERVAWRPRCKSPRNKAIPRVCRTEPQPRRWLHRLGYSAQQSKKETVLLGAQDLETEDLPPPLPNPK
eukprot:239006-Amphidinium_carterae.2